MNRLPQRLAIPKDGNLEGVFKRLLPDLLRNCGYEVDVLVKRVVTGRSRQQNKAVLGFWMSMILEETGYHENDREYIYNQIKIGMGFTEDRVNTITGEVRKVPKQTRGLNKDEYSRFMDNFADYIMHNFSMALPPPERLKAII